MWKCVESLRLFLLRIYSRSASIFEWLSSWHKNTVKSSYQFMVRPWSGYVRPLAWAGAGMGLQAMFSSLVIPVAVATFALCLWVAGNSFLWERSSDRKKRNSIISISTLILAGALIWYLPPVVSALRIDYDKIHLRLEYAYEWDNYNKSTLNYNNTSKRLDEPIVIKYSEKERRLLLAFENRNRGITLDGVLLTLIFPDEGLRIRHEEPWQVKFHNKHYFVWVGKVAPGQPINLKSNLWIKFPKPGNYEVYYSISGTNFNKIKREFAIIHKG